MLFRSVLADERTLDELGRFHVRWYRHRGGQPVGPFGSGDELRDYITRHRLGRPDELLTELTQPGR